MVVESSDHRARKKAVEDIPPSPQGGVISSANNEEEKEKVEDSFDLFPGFFEPPTIGSSSFRSRDRDPHPKDIPNRGHIFGDERLQRIFWGQNRWVP